MILKDNDQAAFAKVVSPFRFKDLREAIGGNSDSNTKSCLTQLLSLRLIRREVTLT